MMLKLIRARQWYKNLVIFLPIIFAGALFNKGYLFTVFLGLISLCLVSSANYIINDIKDAKEDKWHPEKCTRPIASGKISPENALSIALLFFIASIAIAAKLSAPFAICVLALFILTQAYIFFFKKEIFADVILISTNFVIRAVSGALIINVRVSPWLVLCTFFLSMFLVAAKRKGDLGLVKNRYTPEITNNLMTMSTVALIMSYSLYSFLSIYPMLIATLPLALYVIFSYSYLADKKPEIARNPEKALAQPKIILGVIAWMLAALAVVYFRTMPLSF